MRTKQLHKHRNVFAHTASKTLTFAQLEGLHTNAGAGGVITLGLPKAAHCKGARALFKRQNATHAMRIDPNGSEVFVEEDGTDSVAGKYKALDGADGDHMEIISNGTSWVVCNYEGTIGNEG